MSKTKDKIETAETHTQTAETKPKGMGILEELKAMKKAEAERQLLEIQEEMRKKQAEEAERKRKAEEIQAIKAKEDAERKAKEEEERKAREEARKIDNQKRRAKLLEKLEVQFRVTSLCLDALQELKEAHNKYGFDYFSTYLEVDGRPLDRVESGIKHFKDEAERCLLNLEREYARLNI